MSLFLPFCSWGCFMTRIILHVSAALCIYPASLQSHVTLCYGSLGSVCSCHASLFKYSPSLYHDFCLLYEHFVCSKLFYISLWHFIFIVHIFVTVSTVLSVLMLCISILRLFVAVGVLFFCAFVLCLFAYLYGYFASHYGHLISLCSYYAQSLYWRFVFLHNVMFIVVLFLLSPVILHLFMDTLDLFVVFCGGLMALCSP